MKKNQKKSSLFLALVLLITFVLWWGSFSAFASGGGLGFVARPQHPSNQRPSGNTYFDLVTTPGQAQTLEIEVESFCDEAIQIELEINNAYTNSAGGVDFMQHGVKDESLIYGIQDLVSLNQKTLDLKPNETKTIYLDLKMPEESLNGVVIGGIVFTRVPDQIATQEQDGVVVNNMFSFVSGLQIQQSEDMVLPELELVSTVATSKNHRSALVHSIRNSAPALISDGTMTISVYHESDTDPTWVYNQELLKMAPNSLMEHIMYIEEAYIAPGLYRSHIEINWADKAWTFDSEFDIPASEAAKLENHGVELPDTLEGPIKIVLLVIAVFLMILLLVIAFLLRKAFKDREK